MPASSDGCELEFLGSLPPEAAAEIRAILDAVDEAPPPAFSGGGKWEAMHDEVVGIYEVRVKSAGANHRHFACRCVIRNIVMHPASCGSGGLTKPPRSPYQTA